MDPRINPEDIEIISQTLDCIEYSIPFYAGRVTVAEQMSGATRKDYDDGTNVVIDAQRNIITRFSNGSKHFEYSNGQVDFIPANRRNYLP